MDLGATPIFEISVKNCKSEPELKFEVENRKLILPQRTCARHLEYIFINLKTIKLVRSAFSWEEVLTAGKVVKQI